MFRSSENAALDRAIDMCKEMDDDLDDCLRTLRRLNGKYKSNESIFVNYLGLWDDAEEGGEKQVSAPDTDDPTTDDVNDSLNNLEVNASKSDLEAASCEDTTEHSKEQTPTEDEANKVEPRPVGDGRTYSELDKTYKDLSVKGIKLRRDLESSTRQLMHISDMADRTKDFAQTTSKY